MGFSREKSATSIFFAGRGRPGSIHIRRTKLVETACPQAVFHMLLS